ncbi:MAG: hypothetical protein KC503_06055 [Myxococcales bacterium]|nr:hypothetical protein [Myxococcales bacterium]
MSEAPAVPALHVTAHHQGRAVASCQLTAGRMLTIGENPNADIPLPRGSGIGRTALVAVREDGFVLWGFGPLPPMRDDPYRASQLLVLDLGTEQRWAQHFSGLTPLHIEVGPWRLELGRARSEAPQAQLDSFRAMLRWELPPSIRPRERSRLLLVALVLSALVQLGFVVVGNVTSERCLCHGDLVRAPPPVRFIPVTD